MLETLIGTQQYESIYFMIFLGQIFLFALEVYFWIIIVSVVLSWLIAFDVVNIRNQKAAKLIALLEKATEPVYRPLRKIIPSIGGIDISPIIVIFGIYLAKDIIIRLMF